MTFHPHLARPLALASALLPLAACGGATPVDPSPGGEGSVRLLPAVLVEGGWRGAESDGACSRDGDAVTCPAGDAGAVTLTRAGESLRVSFVAARAVTVSALAAEGTGWLPGATSFISNGFQSWSQTGAVALRPKVDEADLAKALAARGDGEVLRDGFAQSWEFTVVGGGGPYLLLGATTAHVFKPWVQVTSDAPGRLALRLVSGGAGESVALRAGERLDGESFHVAHGSELAALAGGYAAALPSRRARVARSAEAGWNSWYELWDGVSQADVRVNAALARQVLAPRLPPGTRLRVVIDDGWEQGWGDWEPNERFPSGLDGLARELVAEGFEPGVWLAPLLVSESSQLAKQHPEWFVGGASFTHLENGKMLVLDVTNPAAAEHLRGTIRKLRGWGYSLLKIDFLFAGTFEGARMEPLTGMQAYERALSIIRDAAGDDALLLAVGAPAVATLPFADAWRVGGDIALEVFGPSWPYVTNQARSVGARAPLCLATLCDADPVLLRGLTAPEVGAGGWVVAFAGGALFLSDDLARLDTARARWALDAERVGYALGGRPALPEDYLPASPPDHLVSSFSDQLAAGRVSTAVVPEVWRMPDGKRVALNGADEARSIAGVEVPPRSAAIIP
ncbi:MAG: alpha-galactosidase [Sorangiineae bacterium]|nr:alpha-galactosidase [Polyangiaceae bacterium]MEB2322018.1 alpha-galactosidase [Sorangiineae bacterium]